MAIAVLTLVGCGEDEAVQPEAAELSVTSSAFDDGGEIPATHTCDGDDVSPPLAWSEVPEDAAELAVLMEDPDAPSEVFVHWVAAGIDPSGEGLAEAAAPPVEGANDFGEVGYAGPCPPEGDAPHRYEVTVFAVAEPLDLAEGASAEDLRAAMTEHVLAEGRLTGRYGR